MEYQIPLKLKYRNPACRLLKREGIDPPGGTLVAMAGRFTSKSANAGHKSKHSGQGTGPRMKAYWGNVLR